MQRNPAASARRAEMGRNPIDDEKLKAEIERLPDLGLSELRARWNKLYGGPAPKFFRRKLLVRAVAYQMQVEAYGGLSAATKRRLREIAAAVRAGNEEAVIPGPRIKPGTRLYRSWKDKTHCVLVLPDGFEWNGSRHGSLSAIAKAITGNRPVGAEHATVACLGLQPGAAALSAQRDA